MADENDDLMIEVTGTSNKATSALDKVINKISEFQKKIESATPALTAFTKKMDSLAESSKAISSLKKLTDTTDKQAVSSKKAEANMAMYQARLDRSNISMAKSKAQADKLSQSLQKVAEATKIDAANAAAFAMPIAAFKQKYNKQAADVNLTPETPEDTYVPTPPVGASKTASEILNSRIPKASNVGVSIDTSVAQANLAKIEEFINSLNPAISNMSEEAQAQFEALAGQLRNVSMQIENQFGLYNKLSQSAASAAESTEYLKLEKRMLAADSAIGRLTSKQNSIKSQMSKIATATNEASSSMRRFGNTSSNATRKASNGLHKFNMRMFTMFTRIAAFKIYSAIAQGLQTGIQNIAQASSKANNAMSALATSSLYLKNSIASALMPVIQALTPAITTLMNKLAQLFNLVGMFFARLFGGATTITVAKTANVNYAASLGKAGTAANKVKKNTESATKAVKELQRSVLGFDELNKLSKPTSNSNSGAETGDNTGTGGGYSAPTQGEMFTTKKIPQNILKMADKVKSIFSKIKIKLAPVGDIIKNWWSNLTDAQKWGAGIGGTAGFVIGGIVGNLIAGPMGRRIGQILGAVIGVVVGAWWAGLTKKEKWGAGIGGIAGATIGGIIGGLIGGKMGAAIGIALGGIVGTIIGKWWADLTTPEKWSAGIGSTAGAAIGGIIGGILTSGNPIGIAVGIALGGTAGAIIGKWWGNLTASEKWSTGIGAGAGTIIGGIVGGILTSGNPIGIAVGAALGGTIGAIIGKWWGTLSSKQKWSVGSTGVGAIAGAIIGTIFLGPLGTILGAGIGGLAGNLIEKFWNYLSNKNHWKTGKEILNKISGFFKSAWSEIQKVWNTAPGWFGGIWKKIQNVFSTVGSWFKNIFFGAWSKVQSVWKDAGKWFGDRWNDIVSKFKPDMISDAMGKAWSWTQDKWSGAGKWFGDRWNDIVSKFKPDMISDAMGKAWSWTQDKWSGAGKWFGDRWNDIVSKFKPDMISDKFKTAWSHVQDAWKGAPNWFHRKGVDIANNITGAIYGAINGVIGAINWVLDKVGSKTKIKPLTVPHYNYAYGTAGHPGGPALVNDSTGSLYREMVQLPNGNTFIPQGRNVLIPDLPKGSKVLPAKETNMLFPHYASGIGAFFKNSISELKNFGTNIWQYISNPKKLLQLAVDKFVGAIKINEPWLSLGNSAVRFIIDHTVKPLKELLTKIEVPAGSGSGVQRWAGVASQALQMTGHYSAKNLKLLLAQMNTESGGNPGSINRWDTNALEGHPSQGLMQVIPSTFKSYALAPYNKNILDPLSNIIAAIRYTWSRYGGPDGVWGRGHGYANGIGKFDFSGWYKNGGLFTAPAIAGIGDDGPEAVLPLNDKAFSQIADGIVKNSNDSSNSVDTDRIIQRMDKLEAAISDMKIIIKTDDRKIAESANRGNKSISRRYNPIASS